MPEFEKPSAIENIAGNRVTEGTLTLIGTLSGFVLAPLLPLLSNSLANTRHKKRVEKALNEVNKTFEEHAEKLNDLSDSQFKIINEAILAILSTTEDEKIKYLKDAINSNIDSKKVPALHASQVSRILRDISAKELRFLIENSHYSRIAFEDPNKNDNTEIPKNTDEELIISNNLIDEISIVSGLISMGLVIPANSASLSWQDMVRYTFSPIVQNVLDAINHSQCPTS